MAGERAQWDVTTHDWTLDVDHEHLAQVRRSASDLAPNAVHLVLEVVAYADDEASALGRTGHCVVRLHLDGSVAVTDYGRGTETRADDAGAPVRKPVMSTKDVRFFGTARPPLLPDGRARRGISVVAALSDWLVHTNRRAGEAGTQRYEHGVPVTALVPIASGPSSGTTVHFRPSDEVASSALDRQTLEPLLAGFAHLATTVEQLR